MCKAHACRNWHRIPEARILLSRLAPADVRLAYGGAGSELGWHAASDFGATTFAALAHLREAATGPAFVSATDDHTRAAALAMAQLAPTVAAAVTTRFGDPHRWRGYEPLDATRRFRANCR